MEGFLNDKETVLLKFLNALYKENYAVSFRIPLRIYAETEIQNEAMLDNLLMALHIRGYIEANRFTTQNQMSKAPITLTAQALNYFNS